MEKNYREYYWKRLDNAAKGFSAISSDRNTNVYRLSVSLLHPVEAELLQMALETTVAEVPSFNVKQRKGLFWYYFESNFQRPLVSPERSFPCLRIEKYKNNGFLFRVSYFECKINLEVFHSLTDGTGALMFLKRLLYRYLSLAHPEEAFTACELFEQSCHPNEYEEDSFLKNYSREQEKAGHTEPPAYRVKGTPLERRVTRVITGLLRAQQVVRLAKDKDVTVTQYLTAVLIRSIHLGSRPGRGGVRPVVICIPVNLRTLYPSHTLSNFFSYLNIGVLFDREYSFDEVLEDVRRQFDEELSRDKIAPKLRYNVEGEKNRIVRLIPLVFKRVGLKLIHRRGERGQTCAMSNLGRVDLPDDMHPYVERFDVMLSTSDLKAVKTGLATFGDTLSFSFTSNILETDIQQYFFSFLSAAGVEVEIAANEL